MTTFTKQGISARQASEILECEFCDEIGGQIPSYIRKMIPVHRLQNRIILSTDSFVIFPPLGSFTPGYLMIVPKKHYYSIAAMPELIIREFLDLKSRVASLLQVCYGTSSLFFEHSSSEYGYRAGCCIDHAHLHVVPTHVDVSDEISQSVGARRFASQEISSYIEISRRPYLLYENQKGLAWVVIDQEVPSQYVRILLTRRLGMQNMWDWAVCPFPEQIIETFEFVSNRLSKLPLSGDQAKSDPLRLK